MIRALFEQGKDYIDSFWPFLVKILPSDGKALLITEIQNNIKSQFSLLIPLHCLNTIITRAHRQKYVCLQNKSVWLTKKGMEYQSNLELDRDVERRINDLLEDVKKYLFKQSINLSTDEISIILYDFIAENIELSESFLHPDETFLSDSFKSSGKKKFDQYIYRYLINIEKSKPNFYRTLQDIVCGSIISLILRDSLISNPDKKFGSITLFFDSNFILSLLGFDDLITSQLSTELLGLIKKEKGFKLKVFDFTVKEISLLLRTYLQEGDKYLQVIDVNSLFSRLKSRGWTQVSVIEFISHIEEEINQIGIDIQPTLVRLKEYDPERSEDRTKISIYKPEQSPVSQNHDLAAITTTKNTRGHPIRQIENAISFFVTSDIKLFHYNLIEWGHSSDNTVAEVITDRILTNLLWLKNPNTISKIQINSLISIHSHDLFIDKAIWKRFLEIVQSLRNSNTIDDKDVALLLYDNNLQDALKEIQPTDTKKVSPLFVLKYVQVAKDKLTQENLEKLEKSKIDFNTKEKEKMIAIMNVVDGIKESIYKEVSTSAKKSILLIRIVLGILFVFTLVLIFFKFLLPKWEFYDPLIWIVGIFFFLLNMLGFKIPKNIKLFDNLENRLYNKNILKKINTSKIGEIEKGLEKVFYKSSGDTNK